MQVMPLLTPTSFLMNTKKRSRSTVDDFESQYLKKRLISTITPAPMTSKNIKETIQIDDCKPIEIDDVDNSINPSQYPRIHVLDINGTMLPMEQKPGESKYSIPDFVLGVQPITNKQLILYQDINLFNKLIPENKELEELDNSSITSEENDEEFEPMDID